MRSRVLLVFSLVLVVCAGGCDWVMFGYGPDHSGWNASERAVSVGNVAQLTQRFVAPTGGHAGSPVIANAVAYVSGGDGQLYAFDAAGRRGCSGTPTKCKPLWIAHDVTGTPAVVNGVVYAAGGNRLNAFDAAGRKGCSGTPATCTPLWSAVGPDFFESEPTVTEGVVYITGGRANINITENFIFAFDASGTVNCTGVPRVCNAVWSAGLKPGQAFAPAVSNGVVYVATNGDGSRACSISVASCQGLSAFDAAGRAQCASGTPRTCSPLWIADGTGHLVVVDGVLYGGDPRPGVPKLAGFDAGGNRNCGGSPKQCTPIWLGIGAWRAGARANAVIYGLGFGDTLYANDAAGAGCSGAPPTCPPLWSATLNDPASPVAVANGVVYLQTEHVADGGLVNGTVLAFDAAGVTRCAGTPRSCTSLWSAPTGADAVFSRAAPVVANGIVYAGSHQGLYAFALP
jgi:hypothetical protein